MDGLLLINKSEGPTSFDVIRVVRKAAKTKKVGHTGTLDPAATGLLPVTLGRATRFSQYLILDDKSYEFNVVFGVRTDTDDAVGESVETGRNDVTAAEIEAALPEFAGEIQQVPPKFSAIHVNGRRAYDLAREGVDFELPARPVRVDSIELLGLEDGIARMRVDCGSGTYVRSIARDLGWKLGTCAHAHGIHRTRVGGFSVEDAIPLAELDHDTLVAGLVPMVHMLAGMAQRDLDPDELIAARFGQLVPNRHDYETGQRVAMVAGNELIGVAEVINRGSTSWLQPRRMVPQDG